MSYTFGQGDPTLPVATADQLFQGLAHNLAEQQPRLFKGHPEDASKVWCEGRAEVNGVNTELGQQRPHLYCKAASGHQELVHTTLVDSPGVVKYCKALPANHFLPVGTTVLQ